jgi:spermidine synthase
VTGAAIMIVEILGARMLAPYFGTSHFVWTAQIAITLVALAAGYYAGGRLVDASPKPERIYVAILVAAVYLCLAVWAVRPVSYWCLQFSLAAGSLLASAFLFFVPLLLLAMVGPFFIRVLTGSVAAVGGNVGRLTAIGTLGSFLGTLLIGYWLIPTLPNSFSMYGTAVALMLVAAAYFLVWSPKRVKPVAAAMVAAAGLGAYAIHQQQRSEFANVTELARANSPFGLLQVLQEKDGPRRYYLNDYLTQNTYDTEAKQSVSMFTYMLHLLAKAYTPEITNVLCIGLGVGIVPMQFANEGASVDVVEINPDVLPLAQKYFDLEPARLNITIGDGRYFVNQTKQRYDTIILDAFLGDSSPAHLMTREAFSEMRRTLKPHGTLVINSFGDFGPGRDFLTASIYKTLASVFGSVRIHAVGIHGNTLFVASANPDLRILRAPDISTVHPEQRGEVAAAFEALREVTPGSGRVLTDDYNPVEVYDAVNREQLRKNLVAGIRKL